MFTRLLSAYTIGSFGESLASKSERHIKYVSLNNGPYLARPKFVNMNSDKTLFYPFSVSVNKCGGSCNTLDNPYHQDCFPNQVKIYECKSI